MIDAPQLAAILAWQIDAGVDEAIEDDPIDRLLPRSGTSAERVPQADRGPPRPSPRVAASEPLPEARRAAPARPASGDIPLGAAEAAAAARAAAAAAASLEELEAAIRAFDGCALKFTATTTVFADGTPQPAVMVIGEAPGQEEDRQGLPFVGPAGRLLDKMLGAIGLTRQDHVRITNMIPWRPPGNRTPSPSEIDICLPFLARHIALVNPRLLVLTGGTATSGLLGTTQGITKLRGRWFEYTPPESIDMIPCLATYHPAYLLRNPIAKRESWFDLLALSQRLHAFAVVRKG